MHISTILVKRYVGALFAVAKQKNLTEEIVASLQQLDNSFKEVPELLGFIRNPEVPSSRKLDMLLTALGKDPPEPLRRFFELVLRKNREEILPSVFQVFYHFREESLGRVQVIVNTAVTVTPEMQRKITQSISQITPKTPVVQWDVDPRLLGGYRILIENRSYDFSLARQLTLLQEQMIS